MMSGRSRNSGMATPRAIHYREKARELHEASASASNDQLRDQFVILARQYEVLASNVENMNERWWPRP
jgi:hypothetical protein